MQLAIRIAAARRNFCSGLAIIGRDKRDNRQRKRVRRLSLASHELLSLSLFLLQRERSSSGSIITRADELWELSAPEHADCATAALCLSINREVEVAIGAIEMDREGYLSVRHGRTNSDILVRQRVENSRPPASAVSLIMPTARIAGKMIFSMTYSISRVLAPARESARGTRDPSNCPAKEADPSDRQ